MTPLHSLWLPFCALISFLHNYMARFCAYTCIVGINGNKTMKTKWREKWKQVNIMQRVVLNGTVIHPRYCLLFCWYSRKWISFLWQICILENKDAIYNFSLFEIRRGTERLSLNTDSSRGQTKKTAQSRGSQTSLIEIWHISTDSLCCTCWSWRQWNILLPVATTAGSVPFSSLLRLWQSKHLLSNSLWSVEHL